MIYYFYLTTLGWEHDKLKTKTIIQYKTTDSLRKTFQVINDQS